MSKGWKREELEQEYQERLDECRQNVEQLIATKDRAAFLIAKEVAGHDPDSKEVRAMKLKLEGMELACQAARLNYELMKNLQ